MSALLSASPLLLRRRGALADVLPVVAFAAASAILATVLGGLGAFLSRAAALGAPFDAAQQSPEGDATTFFVVCAVIACVLLVPSAVGLGGSAARLSLARREQDLAAMRLVGGTTAQVGGIAVLDVTAQAVVGGILGLLGHLALAPALTALDFGITPFAAAELLLPWWAFPLLLLGLALLAAGSAAISLLGVAVTPLGVARGSRTVRMSIARVLVWVLLLVGFAVAAKSSALLADAGMAVIVGIFGTLMALVMLSIAVVGPFLVWVAARIVAAVAPTPSLLVGARRLAADPRAGWRAVSGITCALVIAGFLTLLQVVGKASNPDEAMVLTGLRTGGMLTLAIAAVLAAVATGVTQTARVIDQAPLLEAQHVAGAEVGQLHRARLAEIAIPLALSSVVAALTALVLLLPMLSAVSGVAIAALGQFVMSVLAAYALVLVSVLVAAPLVRRGALGRV
ncbi:FtsX-like permease family protein [Brachybacterium huguangmaarense]